MEVVLESPEQRPEIQQIYYCVYRTAFPYPWVMCPKGQQCHSGKPLASRFYPHTKHSFPSLSSSTPSHCLACPHLLCSLCTTERGWGFSKPGTWWGPENTLETHRAHPAPSHRASHTELCHTHWADRMAGSSGSCLELTGDKAAASVRCNFHTLEKYITCTHTQKGW